MKNTLLNSVGLQMDMEQEKKQIMMNIKELQRDLIKASFKQSSDGISHAALLQLINAERDKIKVINQQVSQSKASE